MDARWKSRASSAGASSPTRLLSSRMSSESVVPRLISNIADPAPSSSSRLRRFDTRVCRAEEYVSGFAACFSAMDAVLGVGGMEWRRSGTMGAHLLAGTARRLFSVVRQDFWT